MPNGQFGTRLQGGKDSASPRYIFTQLSPLAEHIFNPKDAPLLNTLYDDNQKIEPEYYVPLIPMVLVNGADGIGTGWMTKIPNFNPREIVKNIRRMIDGLCAPYYLSIDIKYLLHVLSNLSRYLLKLNYICMYRSRTKANDTLV